MRNVILLAVMAAAAIPGVANAQSRDDIRHDRREVRDDRRDVRDDRRDRRHDRRDWRGDHREAYAAPYGGWRYRPVTVGFQLRPAFWGDRYVVSDYGRRSLSAPRMNQRWVRYGNDLLLINVRNGRVLQVLPNRY